MAVQLPCHVQNFVAIILPQFGQQIKPAKSYFNWLWILMEKDFSEMGPKIDYFHAGVS